MCHKPVPTIKLMTTYVGAPLRHQSNLKLAHLIVPPLLCKCTQGHTEEPRLQPSCVG